MSRLEEPDRPSKRIKLDSAEPVAVDGQTDATMEDSEAHGTSVTSQSISKSSTDAQAGKETEVGITEHVNQGLTGFKGILKKRYTDFLVNEILPSGQVLHLENTRVLKLGHGKNAVQNGNRSDQPPQRKDEEQGTEEISGSKTAAEEESERVDFPGSNLNAAVTSDVPTETSEAVSEGDIALLNSYFSETTTAELISLYEKILASPNVKPKDHGTVRTAFTTDRSVRGKIHESIRRIFHHRIDSSTDSEGTLVLTGALPDFRRPANQPGRGSHGGRGGRSGGRPSWTDRGGEYLHFSLFKENRDTMEIISMLSRQLKTNAKAFQFAGTKDRRAVTVQRCSAFRVEAERVASINKMLRGGQVGDFEYHPKPLALGDLAGNEFVITLRDCRFPFSDNKALATSEKVAQANALVSTALRSLCDKGFANYYGLQRFGTFKTRTDTVGLKLLQSDFRGACDDILAFDPEALAAAKDPDLQPTEAIGTDDKARAEAIHLFRTTGRSGEALEKLPRKFSGESNVIRQLGRNRNDYYGALMLVPRNLRLMYVHAYQSFVWNHAASERWRVFGSRVVEGDLVLVDEHRDKVEGAVVPEAIDADGEVVVQPGADDKANNPDDVFERARALSQGEAESGEYSIFDVVLPLPGFDVLYPANEVGRFYQDFMGSEAGGGLDPHDMTRKQRDFSLSGGYRKVVARIGDAYGVEMRSYGPGGDDEQFVQTDLERIRERGESANGLVRASGGEATAGAEDGDGDGEGGKIAVVLTLQLGSSQYATMALRELAKGGIEAHKSDFGGRG